MGSVVRRSLQEKMTLNSQPVLIQPNNDKDFILETNVSNTCILSQENNGDARPIAYSSREILIEEKNCSITKKYVRSPLEMLNFEYFLNEREFQSR